MNRFGWEINIIPRKIQLPNVAPYETAFDPLPREVVKDFAKEIKRQGRDEFFVYGCWPTVQGDECMLVMADWIGNDSLLKEDMELISGLHERWIRKMAGVSPSRKRKGRRKP
jgi:hypothetical protein